MKENTSSERKNDSILRFDETNKLYGKEVKVGNLSYTTSVLYDDLDAVALDTGHISSDF